jgi:dephospho-CoA kinase
LGYETRLFSSAFVYHKRRIDWDKFSIQVSKFGKARPILNFWYPEYKKLTYWFPSLFVIGFVISFALLFVLFDWALKFYFLYFILIFIVSSIQNRNPLIGLLSIVAVWKQFFGYGIGFLTSFYKISVLGKQPQEAFPELFFRVSEVEDNYERSMFTNKQNDVPIQKSVEKAIDKIINPIQKLVEPIEKKTKVVGLTGGIGSGKTAVAHYMQSKGIPVYISDLEAKKVMEFPEIIAQISNAFGTDLIDVNKVLNREKLASMVFKEPEKLKQLNSIVHPAVKKHFDNWILQHQKFPLVVKEAAILFESGSYKDCDMIITVSAPLETRIERVLKRDKTTREKILQRINNQLSDEERIARSQFVVKNENFDETKKQVDEILNLLKYK